MYLYIFIKKKFLVSDLKEPPPEFRGEVDIEDFWKSVNLEMIGRGFVPSKCFLF